MIIILIIIIITVRSSRAQDSALVGGTSRFSRLFLLPLPSLILYNYSKHAAFKAACCVESPAITASMLL